MDHADVTRHVPVPNRPHFAAVAPSPLCLARLGFPWIIRPSTTAPPMFCSRKLTALAGLLLLLCSQAVAQDSGSVATSSSVSASDSGSSKSNPASASGTSTLPASFTFTTITATSTVTANSPPTTMTVTTVFTSAVPVLASTVTQTGPTPSGNPLSVPPVPSAVSGAPRSLTTVTFPASIAPTPSASRTTGAAGRATVPMGAVAAGAIVGAWMLAM
ncbi:hypothetical protein C8R43DRAFT_1129394 [Mycena crocata]|nr:hypothetical protein C8R43DRAFT_1129394 [Mycena crocata]